MPLLNFIPLVVALVIFLLSTLQFAVKWRALIWLTGVALTGLSIWMATTAPSPASFLATAIAYPDAILKALDGNWQSVGAALPPLFDILCIATVLIAIGCLIAFTPGDAIERFVIPFNIAALGVVAGALTALVIAGVGFGGAVKRKVYVGVIEAADVYDGDTFAIGDVSLRLWGVDAPEKKQVCDEPHKAEACGVIARGFLVNLVDGQLLVCAKPNDADGNLKETFGRPLVTCRRQSDGLDIGQALVRAGCATPFSDNGKIKSNYQNDIPTAGGKRVCPSFMPPEIWRDQR